MNFLQRLFSQPKMDVAEPVHEPDDTSPLDSYQHREPEKNNTLNELPAGLHIGKLSNVGRERKRNEDSLLVMHSLIAYDYGQEPFGLFIVTDGMGGHQKGEMASSLAARSCASCLIREVYQPYLTNERHSNDRPINEILVSAVIYANKIVQQEVPNGGTTLTAALILGNSAYIAHIGDTRAYVLTQNNLKQITKDHSLASRLVEMGESSQEEIQQAQSILYKAIGQSDLVEADVDTYVQHLPEGASLLICTDGLWGLVSDDDVKRVLTSVATPQDACEQLVDLANQNGGRDNITAIVISMGIES